MGEPGTGHGACGRPGAWRCACCNRTLRPGGHVVRRVGAGFPARAGAAGTGAGRLRGGSPAGRILLGVVGRRGSRGAIRRDCVHSLGQAAGQAESCNQHGHQSSRNGRDDGQATAAAQLGATPQRPVEPAHRHIGWRLGRVRQQVVQLHHRGTSANRLGKAVRSPLRAWLVRALTVPSEHRISTATSATGRSTK